MAESEQAETTNETVATTQAPTETQQATTTSTQAPTETNTTQQEQQTSTPPTESANTTTEEEFVNFGEIEGFKDIFKESKIQQKEYQKFMEQIQADTSQEVFFDKASKIYGDKLKDEVGLLRETTTKVLSLEEQKRFNSLPSDLKLLYLKAINSVARENKAIQQQYGIKNAQPPVPPKTQADYKKEFIDITNKIVKNEYKTADEFEKLKSMRVELAKKL
jgi:hypothetical protein